MACDRREAVSTARMPSMSGRNCSRDDCMRIGLSGIPSPCRNEEEVPMEYAADFGDDQKWPMPKIHGVGPGADPTALAAPTGPAQQSFVGWRSRRRSVLHCRPLATLSQIWGSECPT